VVGAFPAKVIARKPAELLIDQRHQLCRSFLAPITPIPQNLSDVG
jgi:hypothetical protein